MTFWRYHHSFLRCIYTTGVISDLQTTNVLLFTCDACNYFLLLQPTRRYWNVFPEGSALDSWLPSWVQAVPASRLWWISSPVTGHHFFSTVFHVCCWRKTWYKMVRARSTRAVSLHNSTRCLNYYCVLSWRSPSCYIWILKKIYIDWSMRSERCFRKVYKAGCIFGSVHFSFQTPSSTRTYVQ